MKRLLSAAFCIAAILGLSSTAEAVAILQLSTDANFGAPFTITISDNVVTASDGGAGDSNATLDRIVNSRSFSGFDYTVVAATAREMTDVSDLQLQVQSLTRTGTTESLYIRFTRTDLDTPVGNPTNISSSVSATDSVSTTSVSFRSFADPLNGAFGQTVALPNQPCMLSPGLTTNCGGTVNSNFNQGSGPFSLSNQLTVTLGNVGDSLGNANGTTAVTATAVPEPGSLLLLASGLASAAAAVRRRRRSKA